MMPFTPPKMMPNMSPTMMPKIRIGEIENPVLLKKVADYLSANSSVLGSDEQLEPLETAKTLVSTISNQINFHEIREINISNE